MKPARKASILAALSIHLDFRNLPHNDAVRIECEGLENSLREEFPETSKLTVTLKLENEVHEAHVHVTGKDIDFSSAAKNKALHEAVVEAFERVRRQLRKHHDKLIFSRRRNAQKVRYES